MPSPVPDRETHGHAAHHRRDRRGTTWRGHGYCAARSVLVLASSTVLSHMARQGSTSPHATAGAVRCRAGSIAPTLKECHQRSHRRPVTMSRTTHYILARSSDSPVSDGGRAFNPSRARGALAVCRAAQASRTCPMCRGLRRWWLECNRFLSTPCESTADSPRRVEGWLLGRLGNHARVFRRWRSESAPARARMYSAG